MTPWRFSEGSFILPLPHRGRGILLATSGRLRLASLLAVALVVGCAPGSSGAPSSSANLQLARASQPTPAASFVTLGDPDGGPRSRARVTALPNGAALVTGGLTAKGATGQVLYFDPLTSAFTTVGSLAEARYDHQATLLATTAAGTAEVLVTGGYDDRTQLASVELVTVDLATPSASKTRRLTPLREARSNHQAMLVAKGVLIVGGCVPRVGRDAVPSASSLVYRLETRDGRVAAGQPVETASQPSVARFGHQAVKHGDDRVLVFGGQGADPEAVTVESRIGPVGAAEVFEPSVERWTTVRFEESATPAARTGHRLAPSLSGGALVIGPGSVVEEIVLDARDPSVGKLVTGANLGRPRSNPEVAVLDDGRVLVVGGFDPATGAALPSAQLIAADGQTAEPAFNVGAGRFEHGVATVGATRVLVFGGRAARDVFGSPTSGLLLLAK